MPPNDAPILVDCSWIEEGVLLAGSIPTCEEDILFLRGLGVRSILSLTEERLVFYGISPEFLAGLGIGIAHHSVPDTEPPTRAQLAALLGDLARLKETSPALYLHCHAGFGRTGTVLHLHYLNSGLRLAEARSRIAAKRPGCAAVTERQTRFLWQYEADCLKERQRPLGPGAAIPQAAALPFRWEVSGLRVLVITSSSGNSWVVPKGHVEIRETPLETACKEAEEEAGVRGTPGPEPVGAFEYSKYGNRYHVQAFLLHVTDVLDEWDESTLRKRAWLTCSEAANRIRISPLAELVRSLPQSLGG